MRIFLFCFAFCIVGVNGAAQQASQSIVIATDLPKTAATSAYLEVLAQGLIEAGFGSDAPSEPVTLERGEVRKFVDSTMGSFGLTSLQRSTSEGDVAAALLTSPGAFPSLNDTREASKGIIGDIAREEIAGESSFALRLWPYSSSALISGQAFSSIKELEGKKIATVDFQTNDFLKAMGAQPTQIGFSEVYQALETGIADGAVLSRQWLSPQRMTFFEGGTVLTDHKVDLSATFVNSDWWVSLTALQQRTVFEVLESAEFAAAQQIQNELDEVGELVSKYGIFETSWSAIAPELLREAVSSSIRTTSKSDPEGILQFRDEIEALSDSDEETESREPEEEEEGAIQSPAKILFATDRRFDSGASPLVNQFSNSESLNEEIYCGELMPVNAGKIGQVSGVVSLMPGRSIIRNEDCHGYIASLIGAGGGDLIVFVHGYNNTFDDALSTALAFARDAKLKSNLLVWSWPSGGGLASYGYDSDSLEWSQPHYIELIVNLVNDPRIERVDYLAHSMGTQLVSKFMRDNWPGNDAAIVLAAPDLARRILSQSVNATDGSVTTVLATEADGALWWSNRVHARPRAGRAKPIFVLDGMDTIDLTAFDKGITGDLNHRHAFTVKEVVGDLSKLFGGEWRAAQRGLIPLPAPGSTLHYYKIEPGVR
ncbi:alpha/beta hydrolase [Ruegeria sp. HKCCD4332]|uniref:alpha/beta hydrolase n=1 Tax=Ruegeria sp. HKCCD4332 TaxID=2683021 RepID=UPI0014932742|nr:alpha/beta hydrolase [Ruegeria sp. HKCCD4332]NOD75959.1 alpha/beta hydrolase [Ruegeria sp. HKCCD4332]